MTNQTQEAYLVIGGGTSLGENIVDQLLSRGETRVSIFDAHPLAPEQAARFGDSVRVCVGDILIPESIAEAVKSCGTTCIIHPGVVSTADTSMVLYPQGPDQPLRTPEEQAKWRKELMELHKRVNTDGIRNVLSAALENGDVTQLVYVGDANTVFDGSDRPMLREADAPYPLKPWFSEFEARSHGERMVLSFNGVNALRTAVIRPALGYGPGLSTERTLRAIQANPGITGVQIGENTNLVDRTYVTNAAHATLLAADRLAPTHPHHARTAGAAFFISDAAPRPIWDFVRGLWAGAGGAQPKNSVIVRRGTAMFIAGIKDMVGNLQGEDRETWKKVQLLCATRSYDISLAREVLGYAPIVSHDEGIRRTAEWWLERQLKICKGKRAVAEGSSEKAPPPYDREEAALLTEKSPFF
ncbi:hypothetical protein DFH07DRAFT_940490 [Mycena maculata]|uniref:3-beta hydroxysteroid dehydrogenase/isomerase domain-containing protein n=1 Tax=Mycena maculata TaxID=230809 RepID=A0AAD7J6I6_9AGAR|nr:hypothetical protein DFH07DRAFT_940490 [Mycena maculata]